MTKDSTHESSMFAVNSLGWIGWLLTVIFFIINYKVTKSARHKDRMQKNIEKYLELVQKIEDDSLDYWINPDTKIFMPHLIIKCRRLTNLSKLMQSYDDDYIAPQEEFVRFKQAVTLEASNNVRPISGNSGKAQLIMAASHNLQEWHLKKLNTFT